MTAEGGVACDGGGGAKRSDTKLNQHSECTEKNYKPTIFNVKASKVCVKLEHACCEYGKNLKNIGCSLKQITTVLTYLCEA